MAKRSKKKRAGGKVAADITVAVSSSGQVPSWWSRDWLWGLVLLLAVLAAYSPVWWAGYVWDDDQHVTANPCIIGPLGLKEIWTTSAARICPLVLTTFWVEHAFWGLAPLPYHIVNVLMHGVGSVVLWRILLRLRVPGAWLGAALWALHPVQVESVAWITEMKNTESGLFYLLSTLFFLKWLGAGKAGERIQGDWNYVLTLVFAAMAMASKSSTVVLPAVLCLCAWWIEGRWQWRNLARVAPIFLMVLVSVAVSIWTQKLEGGIDPSMARAWPERFATAGGEVWFYLSKLVWPYPLITVYPRWKIDAGQWSSYLPLLAVIAGFSILWIKRGLWARPWFFVMAYFLVALLPVLGFVDHYFLQYSFVADHFQYLASMGPLALIGAGMGRLSDFIAPAKSWPRAAIATGVLLILGLLSWQKAWSYESDETLWNDTLALDPNSWVGYDNLGNALVREGKLNLAVEQYQKSMAINPTYAHTLSNLGTALSAIGRVDEAIVHYQKAIEIDPGNSIIHYDFGNILFQKGDMDGAMAQFQKAVDLHQDYAAAHNNMGNVLLREGRMDEALAQFQRALEIDPYCLESINNLGTAFLREGQFDEARVQFQKALAGNPNSDVIHCNLGNAFFRLGRMAEAVEQYQKAIEINPDNIAAQKNLPQAQAILQQQAGRK